MMPCTFEEVSQSVVYSSLTSIAYVMDSDRALKSHDLLHSKIFVFGRKLCSALLFLLPFWEFPPKPTPKGVTVLEILVYLFSAISLVLNWFLMGKREFLKSKWQVSKGDKSFHQEISFCVVLVVLVTVIDACAQLSGSPFGLCRPIRVLRMFYVIEDSRYLRSNAIYFFELFPTILSFLLFLGTFLASFSSIAMVVFNGNFGGKSSGFLYIFETLFQALTSVAFPDLALSSFQKSQWYSLFFVLLLVVGVFYFLNILTSRIFYTYKQFLKRDFLYKKKQRNLAVLASLQLFGSESRKVNSEVLLQVLMSSFPKADSSILQDFLSRALPASASLDFSEKDVDTFLRLLRFELHESKKPSRLQNLKTNFCGFIFSCFSNSHRYSTFCLALSKSYLFSLVSSLLSLLNIINVIVQSEYIVCGDTRHFNLWILFNALFIICFFLELIVLIVADAQTFFNREIRKWYCFHLVIWTLTSIVIPTDFKIMIICRSLLFFRILSLSNSIDSYVDTILRMVPTFSINFVSLLTLIYVYAVIGMSLYQGLLVRSNDKLSGTMYDRFQFYPVNFNSFSESLFLLFHLLMVNNWNVTYSGIKAVSSRWSFLFFASFHVICVVLMLAVILSFFIESFSLQTELAEEFLREESQMTAQGIASPKSPAAGIEDLMEQSVLEWKVLGKWRSDRRSSFERDSRA